MIEINTNDLSKYINVSRASHMTGKGLALKNDKSRVHFKFDALNPSKCSIMISRGRGSDGKVIINNVEHVLPTRNKEIEINGKEITVVRPQNSRGEIYINQIKLDNEDRQEDKVNMSCDLPTFLKRIGKTKGIKRTDVGLMASEYAEISKGNEIEELETDPPVAYKRDGDKIIFIHPCRIFNVKMVGDYVPEQSVPTFISDKFKNVSEYEQETPATPVVDPPKEPLPKSIAKQNPQKLEDTEEIVYDSGMLNTTSVFSSSDVFQSGNTIGIKNVGKFSVSLSGIQPNSRCTFIIRGHRGSGNGKMGVHLASTDGSVRDGTIVIMPKTSTGMHVKLDTGSEPIVGETYALVIYRPPKSATGEIYINNIKAKCIVLNKQPVSLKRLPLAKVKTPISTEVVIEETSHINKEPLLTSNVFDSWYTYSDGVVERIKDLSKHFSILDVENYSTTKSPIAGTIFISDYKGKLWYNRMKPGLSLDYTSKSSIYHGDKSAIKGNNISLCSINLLENSKRIFLHEFSEDIAQEQVNILKTYSEILTPSLSDAFKIKAKIPEAKTKRCVLPWAHVNGTYTRKDYSIYFESNKSLTNQLLSSWRKEFGKLYIVGSNIKLPSFAEHISSYDSYQNIYRKLVEAKILIYLSPNTDHESGIINLAEKSNVKIVTNNIKYILKHGSIRTETKSVSKEALINKIQSCLNDVQKYEFDIVSYNNYINYNLKVLVGT
jgi:hypothetical protein